MSDIDALVSLTVGVMRPRRRRYLHHALGCEEVVDCANAADTNAAASATNRLAWLTSSAPLGGADDDYND